MFRDIKKILILRPDGIGDLLNSTPAISLLRKSYPDAHITVFVRPLNAEILIGNPDVDEVLIYDRMGKHKRLLERLKFFHRLWKAGYDLAVVMYTASWYNLLAYVSGAKYRVGRYQKRFKSTLTHPSRQTYAKGTVHEVERNLDLVRRICDDEIASPSQKTKSFDLVLNLSVEENQWAYDFIQKFSISEDDFLVCIHPGGSSFDKLWTEDGYAQIADRLVNKFGAKILMLHGPSEAKLAIDIQQRMTHDVIPDTIGMFHIYAPESLRQLAALINCCKLFICNDSGPMHIAAALNVPIVAIFGPTDHVRWAPRSPNAQIARRDMPCWPCSAHKCKNNFECTKLLPVETVWEKIETLLKFET
ncbi:lipopolysaccharide heptosyltransferase II [Candidatus Poribacteria bacterium]|nr:lipopolysaccharide heptosyltransferase II [Candidatus Poribacteria bacterium]